MRVKEVLSSGEKRKLRLIHPVDKECRCSVPREDPVLNTNGAIRRVIGAFWRGWDSLWLGLTKSGPQCLPHPRVVEYLCTYCPIDLIGGIERHVSLTKQVCHKAATRGGRCCSYFSSFAGEVPDSAPPRVTSASVLKPAFTDRSITSGAKPAPSARNKAISRQSESTNANSSKQ